MPREIDIFAKEKAISRYGLPDCLHIPIAARDETAIERFIGKISRALNAGTPNKALLVQSYESPLPDPRLPVWRLKESAIFHQPIQVWVHVDFKGYREAYRRAFPEADLKGRVLDHVLNRRAALLMRFHYLRIIPISRGANSSSGGLAEKYGVEYQGTPEMSEANKASPAFIHYADMADIVKMLDLKTGGTFQDGVRDAIYLTEPEIIP